MRADRADVADAVACLAGRSLAGLLLRVELSLGQSSPPFAVVVSGYLTRSSNLCSPPIAARCRRRQVVTWRARRPRLAWELHGDAVRPVVALDRAVASLRACGEVGDVVAVPEPLRCREPRRRSEQRGDDARPSGEAAYAHAYRRLLGRDFFGRRLNLNRQRHSPPNRSAYGFAIRSSYETPHRRQRQPLGVAASRYFGFDQTCSRQVTA